MKKQPIDYRILVRVENKERRRIGKELWKWFYGTDDELLVEEAITRITGVKDPKK